MDKILSQWSNLPTELLHKISSNHLDTHLDFLRFRAICSAWRHSSSPPRRLLLPSKLPYPLDLNEFNTENCDQETQPKPSANYVLTRSIVYLVQPQQFQTKKMEPSSSTSHGTSGSTSWLVKIEELEHGSKKFSVLSPVSECQIMNVGLEINLLDFRFVEISKAYHLKYCFYSNHPQVRYISDNRKKVLFFPGVDDDEYTIIALDGDSKRLYYVKKGDEEWTKFSSEVEDIGVYNGRLHSVDFVGFTAIYDSCYGNRKYISDRREYGRGRKTFLLENFGRLFLVNVELDVESCIYDYDPDYGMIKESGGSEFRTAVKMKIFCLNEEKRKWEIVDSLGDRILFLGSDCSYSVSATQFGGGCKGNVVYHADEGIELKFEKERRKVYYSNGYDAFIDYQGDDQPMYDEFGCYDDHNYWIDHIDDEFGGEDENIDDEFGADDEPNDDELIDNEFGGEDENIDDEFGVDDELIDNEFGGEDENIDDEFGVDDEPKDDEPNDDELIDDEFSGNEDTGDEFVGDDKPMGDEIGGDDDEPINDEFGLDDEPIDDEFGGGGERVDDEPIDDEFGGYDPNYWMCDCSSSDDDFPSIPRKAYANVRGDSDDVLKGLQGQNIGVFDVQTRKLGSLLMFREGASIFWPPPAWLKNNQK